MPRTLASPTPHPLILFPLLALFLALFFTVGYFLSPLPQYLSERTAVATATEVQLETRTNFSRRNRDLRPEERYWKLKYRYTGSHGEQGEVTRSFPPGAEQPATGGTTEVRYRVTPDGVRGRLADEVSLLREGWLVFALCGFALTVTSAAGWMMWRMWRGTSAMLTDCEREEAGEAVTRSEM